MPEDETPAAPAAAAETPRADEDAQAQADFDAGFAVPDAKAPKAAKVEAAAPVAAPASRGAKGAKDAAPAPAPEPKPEYIQVTQKDWDEMRAAAAKTASHDSQLSKAFGTIGDLQKKLSALAAPPPPPPAKFEVPKDAFAAMERDFPELAQQTRAALEASLRGVIPGGAPLDPDVMKKLVADHAAQLRAEAEIEALDDLHPDWRTIVGQVDISKQQPDPENAFRRWLSTKPADFQAKLNSTSSAAVISRAISRFQDETKPPPPATPSLQAQLRAARIRAAVQPRGDGGPAATANTAEQEFAAGFNG